MQDQFGNVEDVFDFVARHQNANPGHGTACACMGDAIRWLRKKFTVEPRYQQRIDYVIRQALENRPISMRSMEDG